MWIAICVLAVMSSTLRCVHCIYSLSNMKYYSYHVNDTDINFGAIFPITSYSNSSMCSNDIRSHRLFQNIEVIRWYVDKVNAEKRIPGVRLGFYIVDDCSREQVALARSMQFIRSYTPSCPIRDERDMPDGGFPDELVHYPVVAVISGSNSQSTIPEASLLSVFQMPLIAASATSEELNNKDRYQYFTRTVASDNNQAKAIINILTTNNWTYTALVHSADSYGTLGAESVKEEARHNNICIGVEHCIRRENGTKDYALVANMLMNARNLKSIILFTGGSDSRELMRALAAHPDIHKKKFIFIASDGISAMDMSQFYNITIDSIYIELYSNYTDANFYEHFEGITAENTPNDWMQLLFERNFDCKYGDNVTAERSCLHHGYRLGDIEGYERYEGVSLYITAVQVVVDSIADYIKHDPDFPQKDDNTSIADYRTAAYRRFKPLLLLKHIQHTKDNTLSLKYKITQLQYNDDSSESVLIKRQIGLWHINNDTLDLYYDVIVWSTNTTLDGLYRNDATNVTPTSICSSECEEDHYKDRIQNSCCWECRTCAKDKIIVEGDKPTYCSYCNNTQWPDTVTRRYCIDIEPIYLDYDSSVTVFVCVIGILGIVHVTFTLVYFWLHRHVRLIKATDIELSIIGLIGVMICYPSAYFHVIPPSDFICYTASITLHLGFTITYASLLVKTNRIYRLFNSARYSSKLPNFIEYGYQILITMGIISIQIVILFVTIMIWSPEALNIQRLVAVKRVEFMCKSHLQNFLPPIGYNIVLLCLCSWYAFKTRTFPANFNESKLIFLHVLATSFLWLAFIPSYLSTSDSSAKATLLAMLLLIGATLSTLCLHAPKVYAVIYLTENDMNLSQRSFTSHTSSSINFRYNINKNNSIHNTNNKINNNNNNSNSNSNNTININNSNNNNNRNNNINNINNNRNNNINNINNNINNINNNNNNNNDNINTSHMRHNSINSSLSTLS